jgi:hypothetical protein
MLDKLQTDLDAILELVNKTPAPLQETAFKMILEQWFVVNSTPKSLPQPLQSPYPAGGSGVPPPVGTVPDAIKAGIQGNRNWTPD